jgi:hypothetical protein
MCCGEKLLEDEGKILVRQWQGRASQPWFKDARGFPSPGSGDTTNSVSLPTSSISLKSEFAVQTIDCLNLDCQMMTRYVVKGPSRTLASGKINAESSFSFRIRLLDMFAHSLVLPISPLEPESPTRKLCSHSLTIELFESLSRSYC